MSEEELTGDEKYLVCMGYLRHMLDDSILIGKPFTPEMIGEISSRIELKFTSYSIDETKTMLTKLLKFSVPEIIDDIIMEYKNEGSIANG